MIKKRFDCFLKVISPIHIGCGEVYEPTGFIIDEKSRKMIVFDTVSFLADLDKKDKQRFSEICLKGTISSLLEIYKFLRGRRVQGRSVNICEGLVEHYKKTLSIPLKDTRRIQQELNKFEIERTSFLTNAEKSYIPGSSIKGALRTAYLNMISKGKNISAKEHRKSGKNLEELLLKGRFSTDPFRMVKVSDFRPTANVKTKIAYAINQKKYKHSGTARGPYQILEVIEPGSIFYGSIEVCTPENGAGIKNPIKLDILLKSADEFYKKQQKREMEELKHIPLHEIAVPKDEKGYLLRIGRHSGIESITIENYRMSDATTAWLASEFSKATPGQNLWPFGWAYLVKADEKLLDELEKEIPPQEEIEIKSEPSEEEKTLSATIEKWESITISWDPGSQVITAYKEGKKAIAKGKALIPEHLHKKLFKKKIAKATIEVEIVGNSYKIVKIY